METIVSMGEVARNWSLKVLENNDQNVDGVRNALAILREVGKPKKDTEVVKKFMDHDDPRVQEELLHTLMSFNAHGIEPLIFEALTNSDDKLRWRAVSALSKAPRLSKDAIVKILQTISSDPPEDEQEGAIHSRKVAQLIQAMATINNFPAPDRLEDAILAAVHKTADSGKGLMSRLKLSNSKVDHSTILIAAFSALGKIGSSKSCEHIAKFTKGKTPVAAEAQKALTLIESRQLKSSAAQATG